MTEEAFLSIGQVVSELKDDFPEVSVSKVRFLESQGLVSPSRTKSGYRQYGQEDIQRLRWVLEQQRANFLPLRVIRERMIAGDWRKSENEWLDGMKPTIDWADDARNLTRSSAETMNLTFQQLSKASGVGLEKLREMRRLKLIEPKVAADIEIYDEHDLQIAIIAKKLFDFGLEPRHLRTIKHSAERELDLFAPNVQRIIQQGGLDASAQAQQVMGEFAAAASRLRESLIRRRLQAVF